MNHQSVIKDIESGKFEKIYFLHGEEPYYMDLITDAILKNVLEEHERDFNQSIIYGKEAEAGSVIAEAKGYPMMAERRVVVLKEAQDFRAIDDLEAYFSNPSEQTVFVVNFKYKNYDSRKKAAKAAAKNGVFLKCEKIKDYKLADWIGSYVGSIGYSITPKAAIMLGEFLGNDLSKIVGEIEKLDLLVEKGTRINEVHIEENIGISKDYNAFELVNAVAIRDIVKANRIVDYFDHNPKVAPPVLVLGNLFNHFSRLMKIHFLPNKSKEAVASNLRVHPFVAGELLKSSGVYNAKKVAANISLLHEYDLKAKGIGNSSATPGELMKELIYRLMH